MTPKIPFISPDWPAPASVFALCTTREGGVSLPPYDSFNIAHHVGDEPRAVAANRSLLAADLPPGNRVQWLEQVHGVQVVQAPVVQGDACPVADAAWTAVPGVACTVMTADCLPVLFCSTDGTRVAAAHAGWRGLLAGVLEATVQAMGVDARRLMAWLGTEYEVSGSNIILPLGISFYTFQTISYSIDVYRRVVEPTRSFASFVTYVTFWPQLIACLLYTSDAADDASSV